MSGRRKRDPEKMGRCRGVGQDFHQRPSMDSFEATAFQHMGGLIMK